MAANHLRQLVNPNAVGSPAKAHSVKIHEVSVYQRIRPVFQAKWEDASQIKDIIRYAGVHQDLKSSDEQELFIRELVEVIIRLAGMPPDYGSYNRIVEVTVDVIINNNLLQAWLSNTPRSRWGGDKNLQDLFQTAEDFDKAIDTELHHIAPEFIISGIMGYWCLRLRAKSRRADNRLLYQQTFLTTALFHFDPTRPMHYGSTIAFGTDPPSQVMDTVAAANSADEIVRRSRDRMRARAMAITARRARQEFVEQLVEAVALQDGTKNSIRAGAIIMDLYNAFTAVDLTKLSLDDRQAWKARVDRLVEHLGRADGISPSVFWSRFDPAHNFVAGDEVITSVRTSTDKFVTCRRAWMDGLKSAIDLRMPTMQLVTASDEIRQFTDVPQQEWNEASTTLTNAFRPEGTVPVPVQDKIKAAEDFFGLFHPPNQLAAFVREITLALGVKKADEEALASTEQQKKADAEAAAKKKADEEAHQKKVDAEALAKKEADEDTLASTERQKKTDAEAAAKKEADDEALAKKEADGKAAASTEQPNKAADADIDLMDWTAGNSDDKIDGSTKAVSGLEQILAKAREVTKTDMWKEIKAKADQRLEEQEAEARRKIAKARQESGTGSTDRRSKLDAQRQLVNDLLAKRKRSDEDKTKLLDAADKGTVKRVAGTSTDRQNTVGLFGPGTAVYTVDPVDHIFRNGIDDHQCHRAAYLDDGHVDQLLALQRSWRKMVKGMSKAPGEYNYVSWSRRFAQLLSELDALVVGVADTAQLDKWNMVFALTFIGVKVDKDEEWEEAWEKFRYMFCGTIRLALGIVATKRS
ncbi:hypothetical protein CC79DRAFT_1336628 [Sarocladium strictum]